jgi:hypothetical protein
MEWVGSWVGLIDYSHVAHVLCQEQWLRGVVHQLEWIARIDDGEASGSRPVIARASSALQGGGGRSKLPGMLGVTFIA